MKVLTFRFSVIVQWSITRNQPVSHPANDQVHDSYVILLIETWRVDQNDGFVISLHLERADLQGRAQGIIGPVRIC